jgi:shikimate dehydrogenase
MMRLGLTGFPVAHSLSPKLLRAALRTANLEGEYDLYPVEPAQPKGLVELLGRMRKGELDGLNVTIPYKQSLSAWLDELTPTARETGAVNLIAMQNGRLTGHNTDAAGFWADLNLFLATKPKGVQRKKALVLGAGGSARSVAYVLIKHGWQVSLAARRLEQAEAIIDWIKTNGGGAVQSIRWDDEGASGRMDEFGLVVNCTPVGMWPKTEFSAWPAGLPFPKAAVLYDLVYNPRETLLMKEAREAGLAATNGLGMLVEQAMLGFEVWTGKRVARETLLAAVEEK